MRTTARIELPTGVRIGDTTPTGVDPEHRGGPATAKITKVERIGEGRSLAIELELDIELEVTYNATNHSTPNKRGIIVGIAGEAK